MCLEKVAIEKKVILFILFFAVFNDVIRIPNTKLSFFRLSLPIVIVILYVNFKLIYKYVLLVMALLIISLLQNIVFIQVLKLESAIDFVWLAQYAFLYICIIIQFMLVHILRKKYGNCFKKLYTVGIPLIGILCVFGYVLAVKDVVSYIDNRNNYACSLAVVFPWFLINAYKKNRVYYFVCILIVLELIWGDSKVALMGVVMQLGILCCVFVVKKTRHGWKGIYFLIPIMAVIFLMGVMSPVTINGYSIRGMFTSMVQRISSGELYDTNATSLQFRINAIIYLINALFEVGFLGIGIGNSTKFLGYAMSGGLGGVPLSPHIAWLEFFLDGGVWVICLCMYIYGSAMKKFLHSKRCNEKTIYSFCVILSFPVWVISASGIYTTYSIFIVFAFLVEYRERGIFYGDKK